MVDVEMHGTRKMAAAILRASIQIGAGVMPGAIEDPDIRVCQMLRQPFGAYQRFRICIGHVCVNSMSESRQTSSRRQPARGAEAPPAGNSLRRGHRVAAARMGVVIFRPLGPAALGDEFESRYFH